MDLNLFFNLDVLTLIVVGISCSLLGVFLVLKRSTMLVNSLSHSILLGIVLAKIIVIGNTIGTLYLAAFLASLFTAVLTNFFTRVLKISEEVSIGVVFSSLFAIGVVLAIMTKNESLNVEAVMGNIENLNRSDLKKLIMVAGINIICIIPIFKYLKVSTFDSTFAHMIGIPQNLLYYILMFEVGVTVMAAFQVVGVVLALALVVMPTLIARLISKNILQTILWSILIIVFCSILSVSISKKIFMLYKISISLPGLITVLMGSIFLVFAKKRSL